MSQSIRQLFVNSWIKNYINSNLVKESAALHIARIYLAVTYSLWGSETTTIVMINKHHYYVMLTIIILY